ncbi:hypothetical protein ABID19_005581 [Mesorhizobium robiniae]|uniref:Uncharacterized protein n=1 Tax=Mesorhizobium robiniae TaxID=559315 RepID=A0ABV2GWJ5_9HYPH
MPSPSGLGQVLCTSDIPVEAKSLGVGKICLTKQFSPIFRHCSILFAMQPVFLRCSGRQLQERIYSRLEKMANLSY